MSTGQSVTLHDHRVRFRLKVCACKKEEAQIRVSTQAALICELAFQNVIEQPALPDAVRKIINKGKKIICLGPAACIADVNSC
jgi:hypothetical protein